MSIRNRELLKEWFSRGRRPTQEQFADLIDSFMHRQEDAPTDDGGTTAADAAQYAICDFDGFAPAEASSWTDRSNSWGLTDDRSSIQILWLVGTGFIAWPGYGTEYTQRWDSTRLSRKCETLGNNVASKLYRCAADGQLYTYRSRYELAPVPAPGSAQVQDSENGDADHYIYSVNDKSSQKCVLTAANTGFVTKDGRLCYRRGVWNPTGRSGLYYTDPVPTASTSASGVMSAADKTKLDPLPQGETGKGLSKHDFSDQWLTKLANAGIYGREANQLRAVRGLFALTADATDEQIRTALTEYATKNELSRAELEYCAANGCRLWDEDTQAPVMVTHNGGGFFNFMELSVTNFQELPRLRYVSLRAHDDGTWTVTRPGAVGRLVFQSELDTLAARITALESARQ